MTCGYNPKTPKKEAIQEAIIVEGQYDRQKVSQYVEANIIQTNGFAIFKDKTKLNYIKELAAITGLVILTDTDRAGFLIRGYLKKTINPSFIKNAYIESVSGKEKRKSKPSKEGLLGVEGISGEGIIRALRNAGCIFLNNQDMNISISHAQSSSITRLHLYEDGLIGGQNSHQKREKLLKQLNLPLRLSTTALLQALNTMLNYDDYKKLI